MGIKSVNRERNGRLISLVISLIPLIVVMGYLFINYARDPFTPGFGIYPTLNHTERAKVAIIRLALQRALVDEEIIDVGYTDPSQPVVLSTRNIDPYWVLPLEGWDIQVLTLEEIRNEYKGVVINGVQKKRWVRFNETGGFAKVEMGLIYNDFRNQKWGLAYWGLDIWFEYKHDEGWVIQRSRVMVI